MKQRICGCFHVVVPNIGCWCARKTQYSVGRRLTIYFHGFLGVCAWCAVAAVLSSGNDLLGTRVMMPGSFRREHGVMGEEDERGAAGSEMRGRTRAGVSVASYLPEEEMRKFTQQVMEAKGLAAKEEEKLVLDSSNNKGARLMEKMGWGGAGLGAQGQGRVAPVEAKQRAQGLGIGAGGDTVEVCVVCGGVLPSLLHPVRSTC